MKVCAYCGKEITKNQTYGRLGSGLLTHHEKPDCYSKGFRGKNLRAKWFRIRNAVLYKWFVYSFFVGWILYDFNKWRIKKWKKNSKKQSL